MDTQKCRERLLNHQSNVITGTEHNLTCESLVINPDYKFDVYSKDYKDIVEQDVSTLTPANILIQSLYKYII